MEYASVSDEAITFLILDSNWDAWTAIGLAAKSNEKVPMKNCGQAQKYLIIKPEEVTPVIGKENQNIVTIMILFCMIEKNLV
jgi:hypothetical protein